MLSLQNDRMEDETSFYKCSLIYIVETRLGAMTFIGFMGFKQYFKVILLSGPIIMKHSLDVTLIFLNILIVCNSFYEISLSFFSKTF